jgi:uncharacterized protein
MRYNVAQLLKSAIGATREYPLHEDIADLDPSIKPLTHLNGDVQFIRTPEGILVRANLFTTVELACGRCLTDFSLPAHFKIEEQFQPTVDILTGARLPLPEDSDSATLIDAHHILDLTEIVRQSLLLALPQVPICRNACQGLCPTCGQNWNDGPCDCKTEELDPRFAALKALLDNEE